MTETLGMQNAGRRTQNAASTYACTTQGTGGVHSFTHSLTISFVRGPPVHCLPGSFPLLLQSSASRARYAHNGGHPKHLLCSPTLEGHRLVTHPAKHVKP